MTGDPFDSAAPAYGPWITARFDSECSGCWDEVCEGDQIRADGEGGWLCEDCGADE